MLEAGQDAPDFTLPDQNGETLTLSDLRGKTVVLYFYPRADTSGCNTAENRQASVIGWRRCVSPASR